MDAGDFQQLKEYLAEHLEVEVISVRNHGLRIRLLLEGVIISDKRIPDMSQ